MPFSIKQAALSDVGCVRTNNEDQFACDADHGFYIVCDGMGGMAAGEVASAIACNTALQVFAAQPAKHSLEMRMALAIRAANDAVFQASLHEDRRGMGTTLVAAALLENYMLVGNVGDSRAYLLRDGGYKQLTEDHSYINELIRSRSMSDEDVSSLDLKQFESVITRAIGAAVDIEPDLFSVELEDGDTVLLCTDGLTRYVSESRLAELIEPADLKSSCQKLVDEAKAAGGADNVTCLLLRCDASTDGL